MNIAITLWGNRISPVFDSAKTLLIAQISHSTVTNRMIAVFDPHIEKQMASLFAQYRIDVLICGAITDAQSRFIEATGVKLVPFITGDADTILHSYIQQPLQIKEYLMPGTSFEKPFTQPGI